MKEIWRTVVGHPKYEVSNLGRVRYVGNPPETGVTWPGHTWKGRIRKPVDLTGYPSVQLDRKNRRVHILVARAFLGPCPLGKEVNHKDFDKTNPRLGNLEYVTRRENSRHAAAHGAFSGRSGAQSPNVKVTSSMIRKLRKEWVPRIVSQRVLAEKYNVSLATVHNVLVGKHWSAQRKEDVK